jgi:GNAT superfamily N-acetyltransferase
MRPRIARAAYRFAIEDSVYVADSLGGRGTGSALLGELIAACEPGPLAPDGRNRRRQRQLGLDRTASALWLRIHRNLAVGRFQVWPLG